LAFGYGGIYDQDEAERIVEAQPVKHMGPAEVVPQAPAHYPAAEFDKNLPAWRKVIEAGKKTAADLIAMVETKGALTDEQRATLRAIKPPQPAADVQDVHPKDALTFTYAQVADKLTAATDVEQLADAGNLIGAVANADHRAELVNLYEQRATEMEAA
ncbi:MAG TPA: phage recombination protein Bet, partial [Aquabacterium sp.]|nr:phage recombination protein Bet [Aquabacterium sp.]